MIDFETEQNVLLEFVFYLEQRENEQEGFKSWFKEGSKNRQSCELRAKEFLRMKWEVMNYVQKRKALRKYENS